MGGGGQFPDRTRQGPRKQERQQQSNGDNANGTERINLFDPIQKIRLSRVHIY